MTTETPALDAQLLDELRKLDTPTVCNALEIVAPERRGYGYTVQQLVCVRPQLPPMVGYARTATIRSMHPAGRTGAAAAKHIDAYYEYMGQGAGPRIVVIQDLDDIRGYGSFWGEVNSNLHKGLGALGVITDGSVRDVPDLAVDFQVLAGSILPSHAYVHVVDYGSEVHVSGMRVRDGDLIHADQHGAVVIPHAVAAKVPEAAALIARRERVLINAAKEPGFNIDRLRQAMGDSSQVH